jgi:predicted membrane protein
MASLFLLFAFFVGLTVMQISPAELGAIDVVTAIGGLAAFAICALLLLQIVLTLRKLSGPQYRE